MKKILNTFRDYLARKRLEARAELLIAPTAKVNFSRISMRPPGRIAIGAGTIFEGRIIGDRTPSSVVIGCNTFVGNSTLICANPISIGDDVLISWGCTIVDHDSHSTKWDLRSGDVRDYYRGVKDWTTVRVSPVVIGNRAWIGFNTIILRGVVVGEGAVVGCASVVTKDVPSYSVVAGNPARVIREVSNAE